MKTEPARSRFALLLSPWPVPLGHTLGQGTEAKLKALPFHVSACTKHKALVAGGPTLSNHGSTRFRRAWTNLVRNRLPHRAVDRAQLKQAPLAVHPMAIFINLRRGQT